MLGLMHLGASHQTVSDLIMLALLAKVAGSLFSTLIYPITSDSQWAKLSRDKL